MEDHRSSGSIPQSGESGSRQRPTVRRDGTAAANAIAVFRAPAYGFPSISQTTEASHRFSSFGDRVPLPKVLCGVTTLDLTVRCA